MVTSPVLGKEGCCFCRHWDPWVKLLDPITPSEALTTLKLRQAAPYKKAKGRTKRRELCKWGTRLKGNYTLQYRLNGDGCDVDKHHFANFRMLVKAKKRRRAGYHNTLDFKSVAASISPERIADFLESQISFLNHGYEGWKLSFPSYGKETEKYTRVTIVKTKPLVKNIRQSSIRIGWAPQKMGHLLPSWSS